MAYHGKSGKVFVNGFHLSSWFDSFDIQLTADTADSSAFQDTYKGFNAGMKDGTLSLTGFFTATAREADDVLYSAVATTCVWNVYPGGDAVSAAGYGLEGTDNAYSVMSTKDDNVRIATSAIGFPEQVVSLCPLTAVTTTSVGTSVTNAASSTAGGSAYLQVTTAAGSCGVTVEHSTAGGTFSTIATFTAFTTAGGFKKAITGTIKPITRVSYSGIMTLQCSIHRE
jgi:hypothetical protein